MLNFFKHIEALFLDQNSNFETSTLIHYNFYTLTLMGKTQEEAQEIVLRQMEKVARSAARKGERVTDDNSLASQLKKRAEYEKLTVEQKRALVPRRDWDDALVKFVTEKHMCTSATIKNLLSKRRDKFEEFHQAGTSFPEILPYITEQLQRIL